jgi:hypothetical protein
MKVIPPHRWAESAPARQLIDRIAAVEDGADDAALRGGDRSDAAGGGGGSQRE